MQLKNQQQQTLMEALTDEYYDDPAYANRWLEREHNIQVDGMTQEQLCELFVAFGMDIV